MAVDVAMKELEELPSLSDVVTGLLILLGHAKLFPLNPTTRT